MANVAYDKEITALLVVDPYNDFISEGGKLWDRIRRVAEANDCVPHMLQVLNAARKARVKPLVCRRLAHSSAARWADDNVKPGRQARPRAPRARHAPDGHGITADNGTGNLRTRLRLSPALAIRFGVGEC